MQYYIKLLENLKKGNIKPVYLFYGDEAYLQSEAVSRLQDILLTPETVDFNYDRVNGEEMGPREIVELARSLPFMAAKRLLVVKNFPAFNPSLKGQSSGPEDAGKYKVLTGYLEEPLASTCLVFIGSTTVDKRKKLVKTISRVGEVIEFTLLSKRDAGRWLMKQARLAGKTFEPEALEFLLGGVKTELYRLLHEVNKVINYTAGREVITREDVTRVVIPPATLNIFDVVDAIGEKRCADALNGIEQLLLYREPPQRILAMIYRQFRLLLQCKVLQEEGHSPAAMQARLKQHPFVMKKLAKQISNFDAGELYRLLVNLMEIDVNIKRGREEFYPAMERMLINMCV